MKNDSDGNILIFDIVVQSDNFSMDVLSFQLYLPLSLNHLI